MPPRPCPPGPCAPGSPQTAAAWRSCPRRRRARPPARRLESRTTHGVRGARHGARRCTAQMRTAQRRGPRGAGVERAPASSIWARTTSDGSATACPSRKSSACGTSRALVCAAQAASASAAPLRALTPAASAKVRRMPRSTSPAVSGCSCGGPGERLISCRRLACRGARPAAPPVCRPRGPPPRPRARLRARAAGGPAPAPHTRASSPRPPRPTAAAPP